MTAGPVVLTDKAQRLLDDLAVNALGEGAATAARTLDHRLVSEEPQRRVWEVIERVVCEATVHDTLTAAKVHSCKCPPAAMLAARYEKARRCGVIPKERDATGTRREPGRVRAIAILDVVA